MRDSAREFLLHLSRGCLLVSLLTAPWLFGGVEASVERWLSIGVLAALVCWLIAAVISLIGEEREAIRLPALLVPLAGGILLGAFQLAPLPESWLGPPARTRVTSVDETGDTTYPIPGVGGLRTPELARQGQLSHYPASTRLDWGRLVVAVTACFVAALVFTSQKSQVLLYAALAVNGAAIAFLGIAEKLGGRAVLFLRAAAAGGDPFAAFINRNNAAGYLNLCLAGAVGLILWSLSDGRVQVLPSSAKRMSATGSRRWRHRIEVVRNWLFSLSLLQIASLLLGGLIVAGILVSHSRGGILALAASIAAVACLLMAVRKRFALAGLLIAVVVAGGLLTVWTGMAGSVSDRMASVTEKGVDQNGRILHWRDSLQAVKEFPLLGTGLGTYRYVYQPYQHRLAPSWFYHAENQFVEAVVEGGVVGLGLMLLAIGLALRASLSLARADSTRLADGVACVGLFALASQAIHSLFDFGPYIPANRLALAVVCGVVAGRAALLAQRPGAPRFVALPEFRPRLVVPVLGLVLLLNGVVGLRELSGVSRVSDVLADVPVLAEPDALNERSLEHLISELGSAVEARPVDAEGQSRLADLLIYRYRVRAFQLMHDKLGTPNRTQAKQWWSATDIAGLHRRANELERAGRHAELAQLRSDPIVAAELVAARQHLQLADAACPILPQVATKLAELEFLDEERSPAGEWYLRKSVLTRPSDPDSLTRAGLLASQAGLSSAAAGYWRASLVLSPAHWEAVLAALGPAVDVNYLVGEVLPSSPELLLDVARAQYAGESFAPQRSRIVERARELLTEQGQQMPDANRLHAEAVLHDLDGQTEAAIASLRKALVERPTDIEWRFELARLLRRQGLLEEARDEARFCARLDPGRNDIRIWIDELTAALHRGTTPDAAPDRG